MPEEKKRGPGRPSKEKEQEKKEVLVESEITETPDLEIEDFEEEGILFSRQAVQSIIKKKLEYNRIDTGQESDEYLDAAIIDLRNIADQLLQSATGSGDYMQIMRNLAGILFIRPVEIEIARLTEKKKRLLAQLMQSE